jgi:hypothetical protein
MDSSISLTCVYFIIGLVWSVYQGYRGKREQQLSCDWRVGARLQDRWDRWDQWMVLYIHDFVFRLVCTMAGFVALYVSYSLYAKLGIWPDLSSGSALLMTFSFLIGVIGVGGQLHYVILIGKVPGVK